MAEQTERHHQEDGNRNRPAFVQRRETQEHHGIDSIISTVAELPARSS